MNQSEFEVCNQGQARETSESKSLLILVLLVIG